MITPYGLMRRGYFRLKGFPLYEVLSDLKKSQYWGRQALINLQNEKLQALIRHAYETVPFYRQRMERLKLVPSDIRTVEDLPKLPVLTRRDVRDHRSELVSRKPSREKPILAHTGGSTGEPLSIWHDLRSTVWGNAAYYRGLSWAGYDFDADRLAVLFGGSLKKRRVAWRKTFGSRLSLDLAAYEIRDETLPEYHEALREFRPDFLKGYAGATYLLARRFEEAGYPTLPLRSVFTTCEHLPEWQRRHIERVFKTEVFDYYGSVEIYSLGFECEQHDGYHVPEEHVVIENNALEIEGGEFGQPAALVVTDLDNYYMPFIRYQNGDAGLITDEPCRCGRSLKRIAKLQGRISDFLRSTDGTWVGGGIVDYILGNTEHIREFCLIQETASQCRLLYVVDGSDHELPEVLKLLRNYLGQDMQFVTEPVEAIPLTAAGKRRFTMSRLNGLMQFGLFASGWMTGLAGVV